MGKCWCCGKRYHPISLGRKGKRCKGICYPPFCHICQKCVFHCRCSQPEFPSHEHVEATSDPYERDAEKRRKFMSKGTKSSGRNSFLHTEQEITPTQLRAGHRSYLDSNNIQRAHREKARTNYYNPHYLTHIRQYCHICGKPATCWATFPFCTAHRENAVQEMKTYKKKVYTPFVLKRRSGVSNK